MRDLLTLLPRHVAALLAGHVAALLGWHISALLSGHIVALLSRHVVALLAGDSVALLPRTDILRRLTEREREVSLTLGPVWARCYIADEARSGTVGGEFDDSLA